MITMIMMNLKNTSFHCSFCFSVRQKVAQIMRNCANGYFITNLSIIIR